MTDRRRRWARDLGLLLLTTLFICGAVFARAGGGHSFSGGGGHSSGGGFRSGGGGGGGGGGDLGPLLYWLFITHPLIGIAVTIAVIIFMIYGSRQGNHAYVSSTIRRGQRLIDVGARDAALAALKSADPLFDESSFMRRVSAAFLQIQEAWSQQMMETARAFISDGVFERFNLQIDEQKSFGFRNLMEDVAVQATTIWQVHSDRLFDQMSILVTASATDTNVSLEDGKRISTNVTGSFSEVWTFIRRRGAMTKANPGLIEGRCPNCGAPIEMNQNANCAHCKALLRSGEFDWVLCEITQESEWRPSSAEFLPGVAELRERDPDFNLQELEDRASVMFWRRNAAERLGSPNPLRSVAAPMYCARYEFGTSGPPPVYFGECGVGSVNTLGVVSGPEEERALVEVVWSGKKFVVASGEALRSEEGTLQRSVFVLSRKTGCKTDVARAISSAHCPNCGAPSVNADEVGACGSCGVVITDGTRGWVLSDVMNHQEAMKMLPAAAPERPSLVSGAQNGNRVPSQAGLLAWMVQMATADGNVSSDEMSMMLTTAERHHIPRQRIDEMIRAALRGQLDVPTPANLEESRDWLAAMARSALADGNLNGGERKLLLATGEKLGMVEYEVNLLLTRTRSDLYNAAKEALQAQNGESH